MSSFHGHHRGSWTSAPALAFLATAAAFVDLVFNRVAIRVATDLDHEIRLTLVEWGGLARNLAAVAGIVAIAVGLRDLARLDAPTQHRWIMALWKLLVATFAGIFLLGSIVATVLPYERSPGQLVLLDMSAASVLAVLLGLAGTRSQASLPLRFGVAMATATILFSFASHVAVRLAMVQGSLVLHQLTPWLIGIREATYLSAILLLGISALPSLASRRARVGHIAGVLVALTSGVLFLLLVDEIPRTELTAILYGAQRLTFLDASWIYAIPLSLALGLCTSGLFAGQPRNQAAAAGLLFVSAGCAPSAPGLLINMTLGVILFVRTALAMHSNPRTLDAAAKPPQRSADEAA